MMSAAESDVSVSGVPFTIRTERGEGTIWWCADCELCGGRVARERSRARLEEPMDRHGWDAHENYKPKAP